MDPQQGSGGPTAWQQDLVLLLLRAALAVTFLFSGLEKLARGTAYTTDYFSALGIAWPEVTGPAVAVFEPVAALALLAGIFARLAAGLLALEMAVALIAVRLPAAAAASSVVDAIASVRFELLLFTVAVALIILGAGRWSVDRIWAQRRLPRAGAAAAGSSSESPGD